MSQLIKNDQVLAPPAMPARFCSTGTIREPYWELIISFLVSRSIEATILSSFYSKNRKPFSNNASDLLLWFHLRYFVSHLRAVDITDSTTILTHCWPHNLPLNLKHKFLFPQMGKLRCCKHKQCTLTSHIFPRQRKDHIHLFTLVRFNKTPSNTHTHQRNTYWSWLCRRHCISVLPPPPFPEHYPSFLEATGKESKAEIHAKWNGK